MVVLDVFKMLLCCLSAGMALGILLIELVSKLTIDGRVHSAIGITIAAIAIALIPGHSYSWAGILMATAGLTQSMSARAWIYYRPKGRVSQ